MLRVLALLLSFWVARSEAAPFVGFSSFAALSPKFPCSQFLKIQSDKPVAAILLTTFGSNFRCVNRFLRLHKNKPHLLQIHPINGPCRRNKRCDSNEIAHRNSVARFNRKLERGQGQVFLQLKKRLLEATKKIKANRNTRMIISSGLEDDYTAKAHRAVVALIHETLPGIFIVRNRVGSLCADYPCESHGVFPDRTADLWNQDGDDLSVSDDAKWLSRCLNDFRLACILWSSRAQGIRSNKFVSPRLRDFEISNNDVLTYNRIINGE